METDRQCLVCESPRVSEFLDLGLVPIQSVLSASRWEAMNAPKARVRLAFCRECGHIFNSAFDPELVKYTPEYDNALDYSPRFQMYARELAEGLVERFELRGKHLIEIGCGQGEFLRLLCTLGGNRGTGFDPAAPVQGHDATHSITWVQEYYSEANAASADLVYSRHTLEHIPGPRSFVSMVRRAIGSADQTVVFFEVPNVMSTLAEFAIWDVIYPHVSYFSRHSLTYLLSACGFTTKRTWTGFGNQFLCAEAQPARSLVTVPGDPDELAALAASVAEFGEVHRRTVASWSGFLEEAAGRGERMILWGAGAKAVTFLTTVAGADRIEYVVDLNARKHGRHIPVGGQQIVAPEFVAEYRPDSIIVMNPNYETEIRKMLRELNVDTARVVSAGKQPEPVFSAV